MQKTSVQNCPEKTALAELLSDSLDAVVRTKLVGHVEACLNCQSALEQMLNAENAIGRWTNPVDEVAGAGSTGVDQCATNSMPLMQHIFTDSHTDALDLETRSLNTSKSLFRDSLPEIDGFQIRRVIGRGASGVVFEAIQTELDRRVAIKLVTGNLFGDASAAERFLREARSVAALVHPNIARLYQISTSQPCGPFLVFEFVDGVSLETILKQRGALDSRTATGICRNVASAIVAAHLARMVHRDLKPSNILIENESGAARVVDFGLAIDPANEVRITRETFIAGTPAYMSPEQIHSSREIDHRSDIYSLGVVLYEMLTGEIPFRGLAKSTLERIVHEMPRRPAEINPAIPRDLETICQKAMAKRPQHRYPSMSELDGDLERWQQGRPISARPISRWSRAGRWAQRNPVTATLVSVIATLLILAGIASMSGLIVLSRANQRVLLASEESTSAASEALRQRDQLLDTVETLVYGVSDRAENEFLDHDELQITLLKLALDGLKRTSSETDTSVALKIADVNLRLGRVYLRKDDFEVAGQYLGEAESLARQLANKEDAGQQISRLRARIAWEQVCLHVAWDELELATRKYAEAKKNTPPLPPDSSITDVHRSQILSEALGRLDYALLLADKGSTDDPLAEFRTVIGLGDDLMRTSPPADEGEMDTWAYQGLHVKNEAVMELADSMWDRKDFAEAAKLDVLAVVLNRQFDIYGQTWIPEAADDDPAASSLQLAETYWSELILSEDDLKTGEPLSNEEKLGQADSHFNLAGVLVEMKRIGQARKHLLQAIILYREVMTASNDTGLDVVISFGDSLAQAVEIDQSSGKVTERTTALLTELGQLVESFAGDSNRDDDLQREINRLKWQYSQLIK